MSFCINLSNPEYIALREQAAETEDILLAKIIDWQNKNNTDRFPSLKEIGVKEKPAPIKPGVEELFDSNPELANEVYEAVGVDVFQLKEDVDVTNAFLTARQHKEAKRINSGEFDDTKLDLKTELQNIIDNSTNPLLVELAKSIQNKESLKTIKAYSTQKLFKTKEGFEPAAAYQAETQRLVLFLGNTARFENKEREYQYLLHELVHHFVDRELVLTNSKQAENIRQLFKYTKYQLTKAGKENLYGLTNFHEFVTEALTNPDFQKELKSLQVPDQFLTKSFSIFDYFLELISKVLGTNKSVLEAVVSQAADIFELQEYKKSLSITPQQKQQAQQLYSQYLDTIFPDSQVKDIVYHTNNQGRIEFGTRGEKGLFVTPTWELAKTYKPGPYGKRFQLLINSNNVLKLPELELMKGLKRGNEDTQKYSEEDYTEYVVFEPKQIYELGSKQDIEGFKEFTQGKDRKATLSKPEYKKGDVDKATKFLQEKLGMTDEEVIKVIGLVDNKAFGRMTTDGNILLSDLMEVGTEYHEAFHRVWNFYITPKEKQDILEEFKKDPRYKEKIEYLEESYPELSEDDLIEEYFAEDFRDFMMAEAEPKTKLETIYSKLIKFLKSLVGIKAKDAKELYKMISQGRFAKAKKINENTVIEKDRKLTLAGEPLSAMEKKELLTNIDYYFATALFSTDSIVSTDIKSIYDFTEGSYSKEDVNKLYNVVLKRLQEELFASDSERANELAQLFDSDEAEVIKTLKVEHLKRLASFNIKLKYDAIDDNNDSVSEQEPDAKEEKAEQGRDSLGITPAFEFNTKDGMPKVVKLLISAIPQTDSDGDAVMSKALGITQAGSWNNNVNILKNNLATVPADIDNFMKRLAEVAETNPQFKYLLENLGYDEGKTSAEFMAAIPLNSETEFLYNLRRDFVSEFALTKYNFYLGLLREDGVFRFKSANSEHVSDAIRTNMANNFQRAYSEFDPDNKKNKQGEFIGLLASSGVDLADKLEALGIEINETVTQEAYENIEKEVRDLITTISRLSRDDYFKIENIFAKAKTNTQSKTSVSGRIDKIVSLLAKSSNENNELQFFNIEGKPVYLINQNTYQTIVIDAINYYLDEAEKDRTNEDSLEMVGIRKKLLQKNIPHLFSSQAPNSVWINRILDGTKLEYGIIEGIKNEEDATGTHSSELKEPDLMSLNMNLTLSGFSVSMKHSDRSVYPIYKLGTDSSILSETTNPIKDAIPIIQGYLTDEINKPNSDVYTYMKITKDNYLKKSFFGEMVSYELFQALVAGDITVNNPKVVAGIREYLSKLTKTNKDQFQEYQLDKAYANKGKGINRKSIGIPNEILVKFDNSWENAVDYATVETLLQNYEQCILFVGDIAAYEGSKALSKRLNTQSSTGRLSLIGEEIDSYIRTKNEESKFTIGGKEYTYKEKEDIGTIRELVIKDPSVKAYFFDGIRKAIYDKLVEDFKNKPVEKAFKDYEDKASTYADNYVSAYENYTENDGFSYINIFMAREFDTRSSEWSDAKQRNFDLQIKFLNSGYNFDSIKEDLEVPEGVDVKEWLFSTYSPLSIKKPQYVGPNDFSKEGDLNIVGGRKTAYMPLVPTEIHGVALNAVHEFMLTNSIDVLHMQGAAKFGVKEMRPLYTEGKWDVEKISGDQLGKLPWKFMKNQVKIANEPKDEITSSTQSRKNILEGFFNEGLPSDYPGTKEEWNSLSEEAKRSESDVYDLVRTYETTQNQIIERSHKALLKELNAVEYSDTVSYGSLDNLRKILIESAVGRNSPDNVIEAAENFMKEVKYIELLPNNDRIQPILNALVTNRVLVQKRLGDMVPQAAVTGFETSPRTYDKDGNMESARDSLKFYEVNPDGSISPAEIMIPITPSMLEMAFNKYNTRNVVTALDALNADIVAGNVEIIAKGLRIPNQQYSSNDVFKIKKFFSPLVQGMAVVPSEMVAKTGGDFDIDKISVYYFHLDENGKKIELNPDKNAKQSLKALQNHLLETEIKMLLHPSQAKNLFSPVADSPLASSKEKHLTKEDKAGTAMTKLFGLGYNVSASIRFVSGKAGVGQMATWINFTDLAQRHGLKLNSAYPGIIIPIKGLENDLELGKNIDNSGESISIVLSALLTSQVDLVSNPYAEALNIINQTLDTVAYMVVRGLPASTIIDIMKSPVVSEFLKAERINQSEVIKSTGSYNESYNPEGLKKGNDALVEEFMGRGEYKKGLPTIEEISNSDSRISGNLFNIFIQFRQQSKEINKVKRYYSPDTKYLKDRNGVNQLNQLYAEINAVTDDVVPIITIEEQDKLITEGALLEGFHKGRMLYDKLYNQFFFLDKLRSYQGFKKVLAKASYMSTDETNKLFNSMDQNFITYLLQNYSSVLEEYGYTFDRLLKSKDSVANKYVKYKTNSLFEDNFFVKNIMPLVNYRQTGINNFRLYKGKMTTSDANEQIESFEELAELDASLAAETILANLFQSGTYNSSFQLNKAIPYDYQEELLTDLNPIIKEILADSEIKDDEINKFMHNFLLGHAEHIPETWKIIGNEKFAFMPYGKNEDGSISVISKGKRSSVKTMPIGNYQGINYTTKIPLTDNFKVGVIENAVETTVETTRLSNNIIEIAKINYTKQTTSNKSKGFFFTENLQAYLANRGRGAEVKFDLNPSNVKLDVTANNNQAGIRQTYGQRNLNAFAIISKKYQQNATGAFVKAEGQFKNTDEDFELFKEYNLEAMDEALAYNKPLVIAEGGIATGKSALPLRFAEWLNEELKTKFDIQGEIKKNTTEGYNGYGIFNLSIKPNITEKTTDYEIAEKLYEELKSSTGRMINQFTIEEQHIWEKYGSKFINSEKVSESEEITNFAKTLSKEQMARVVEKFATNDLVKIFEEKPFVTDVKDFIDEINCL